MPKPMHNGNRRVKKKHSPKTALPERGSAGEKQRISVGQKPQELRKYMPPMMTMVDNKSALVENRQMILTSGNSR